MVSGHMQKPLAPRIQPGDEARPAVCVGTWQALRLPPAMALTPSPQLTSATWQEHCYGAPQT